MLARWLLPAAAAAAFFPLAAQADISVNFIGRHATGVFDKGAAEIPAYDSRSKRLFVVNGAGGVIDVLDLRDPSKPTAIRKIELQTWGAAANSVAVRDGVVAAAVEAKTKTDNGAVVFFDANGGYLKHVTVGALPDMLAFSPDGRWLVVANEGEPNDEYTIDPEGSISVIDMRGGVAAVDQSKVRAADFKRFNGQPLPEGFKALKAGASVAQDIEPEYVAFSADSRTAYVTLQDNNGLAIVDLAKAEVARIVGLGFVDHSRVPLDASDRDGGIQMKTWPLLGMYQPDTIAAYTAGGRTYLVTANEGDARDWKGWSDEKRVAELKLDPKSFPNAAELQKPENLGRLRVSGSFGVNAQGLHEKLYAFGGRSFSIWDADGRLVWNSDDMIERIVAQRYPDNFNASHTSNAADARSTAKGPEPEGLVVATLWGKPYAFVGLERMSGFMVFDISNPRAPRYIDYVNSRDFSGEPKNGDVGDLGPEGFAFIPASASGNGRPLLVVANEVSGTTSIYEIYRK
ncbi:MAG: choice-of-anchor I family protein [Alphaproteobacteria bacterium]